MSFGIVAGSHLLPPPMATHTLVPLRYNNLLAPEAPKASTTILCTRNAHQWDFFNARNPPCIHGTLLTLSVSAIAPSGFLTIIKAFCISATAHLGCLPPGPSVSVRAAPSVEDQTRGTNQNQDLFQPYLALLSGLIRASLHGPTDLPPE